VSLKEVADKVADQLAPLAEVRSSRISVVDDHAEALMGDCASVVEAIRNVAENALKHGPKGNEVKISCGPGRVVTIDDSGPGLMTGDVERLFKPFERGNSHTEGAGLGLAIVKAAVDLHRGSIDVTNSPLGGARFTLRFENIISADTGDGVFREPDIAGRLIPP
jgi:signal transduction histidine kinase